MSKCYIYKTRQYSEEELTEVTGLNALIDGTFSILDTQKFLNALSVAVGEATYEIGKAKTMYLSPVGLKYNPSIKANTTNDILSRYIYNVAKQILIERYYITVKDDLSEDAKIKFKKFVQKDTFAKFASFHSKGVVLKIEEQEEQADDEQGRKDSKIYSELDVPAWDSASKEVKKLFSLLPKYNIETGTIYINPQTGLPETIDYIALYNKLSEEFSNLLPVNKIEDLLYTDMDIVQKYPELKRLRELLPDNTELTYNEETLGLNLLKKQVITSFTNALVPIYATVIEKSKDATLLETNETEDDYEEVFHYNYTSSYRKQTTSNEGKIKQKWNNNREIFLTQRDDKGNKIPVVRSTTGKNGDLYFTYNYEIGLSQFGILTPERLSNEEKKTYTTLVSGIQRNLASFYLQNPIYVEVSESNPEDYLINDSQEIIDANYFLNYTSVKDKEAAIIIRNIKDSLEKILVLHAKYSTELATNTIKNAKGKLESAIKQHNTLTTIATYINNSESLADLYTHLPHLENSIFWKNSTIKSELYSRVSGNRLQNSRLEVEKISGVSERGTNKDSNVTSQLDSIEYLINSLNIFANTKKVTNVKLGESSTYYAINITNNKGVSQTKQSIYTSVDEFMKYKDNPDRYPNNYLVKKLKGFQEMYPGEIQRILKNGDIDTNPFNWVHKAAYDDRAEILSKFNYLHQLTLKKVIPTKEEKLTGKYYTSNLLELLWNSGLTTNKYFALGEEDDLSDYENFKFEDLIDNLDIKNEQQFSTLLWEMSLNHIIQNLDYLSVLLGDITELDSFFKRYKGINSTGSTSEDNDYIDDILFTKDPIISKNSLSKQIGSKKAKKRHIFNTATIEDDIRSTGKTVLNMIRKAIGTEQALPYEKMTVGDGQAYTNLDNYIKLMYRSGSLTKEVIETYKYELLFYKKYLAKDELSEDEVKFFERVEAEIFKKNSKYTLPILKMQYFGPRADTDKHITAMDKMSIAPLLPSQLYYNTDKKKLLTLMKNMVKQNMEYVKYFSVSKAFETIPQSITSTLEKDTEEHYNMFLKEQIKTSSEIKQLMTWGTQFRKLLFLGLFSSGNSSEKVKELQAKYLTLMNSFSDIAKEKLADKLGLKIEFGETVKIEVLDYKKLVDTLKKLGAATLELNKLSQLQVDLGNSLINTFEEVGVSVELQNLIYGIIDKELRGWKVKGNQYIQLSNSYFNPLDFYKKKGDKVIEADVRIALSGDFLNLLKREDVKQQALKLYPQSSFKGDTLLGSALSKALGVTETKSEKIGPRQLLEGLNTLLKDPKWREANKEVLTIVGYRIPTQGHNSMEVLTIREFMLPTAGTAIQLYDEIVAKSGGDFDIDKLSIFLPHITKEGLYFKHSMTEKEAKDYLTSQKTKEESFGNTVIDDLINNAYSLDKKTLGLFNKEINRISKELEEPGNSWKDAYIKLLAQKEQLQAEVININEQLDNDVEEFYNIEGEPLTSEMYDSYQENYYALLDLIEKHNEKRPQEVEELETIQKIKEAVTVLQTRKENVSNQLLELYREVLTLPEVFPTLITPNSTDIIKEITVDLAKKTGDKLIDNSLKGMPLADIVKLSMSAEMQQVLMVATQHLGVYARFNTFHEMSLSLGLQMSRTKGEDNNLKTMSLDIFTEEEEAMLDDRFIDFSQSGDIEGNNIQKYIDESISTSVDSFVNPDYMKLGITLDNIGYVVFLLKQGVPYNRIINLINSRSAKKYFSLDTKSLYAYLKTLPFNNRRLSDIVNELNSQTSTEEEDAIVLNYFLNIQPFQKDFEAFQFYFDQDTTKISGTVDAINNQVSLPETFSDETKKKWLSNSVYSLFDNNNLVLAVGKELFPVLNDDAILLDKIGLINSIKSSRRRTSENLINKSFEQFIYENYISIPYKNMIFNDEFYTLISEIKNHKIYELNKGVPALDFFEKIDFDKKNVDGTMYYNLKIQQDLSSNTQSIDLISSSLTELFEINFRGPLLEIVSFKKLIESFKTDIILLSLQQGMVYSKYNIERYLPGDLKLPYFKESMNKWMQNSAEERNKLYEKFTILFNNNNPTLFTDGAFDLDANRYRSYVTDLTLPIEVKLEIDSSKKINIYAGTNENAELSNFAIRSFEDKGEWDGLTFRTVEGAYQAAKMQYTSFSGLFNEAGLNSKGDDLLYKLQAASGAEAKKLGQTIKGLNVKEWDKNSSKIMKNLLIESFKQNPEALDKLLATGNAELTHTQDKGKWGKEFPKLLMEVRSELRNNQQQTSIREYTPENIITLEPNEVFVFGSNTEGRHGKGAALIAKQKFGAIQGQSSGLQGQSYAIITKDLTKSKEQQEKSIPLEDIQQQLLELITNISIKPTYKAKKFLVTKLGSSLAGYSIEDIKNIFQKLNDNIGLPENLILPKEYEVRDNAISNQNTQVQQLDKINDVKELALVNKDRKIKVTFTTRRYDNTFEATVTGETEVVLESFSKNDITGEISNYEKIEHLQLKTNTGKIITASEADIEGLIKTKPNEETKIPPCAN